MNKKKKTFIVALLLSTFALTGTVYAIAPLVITSPVFGTIGQNDAVACDTDGVATSYTYGASSNNGIKVTSATVTGMSTSCSQVQVIFLNSTTEVSTYSGTNTTGSLTIQTNIWTNEFSVVRVVLLP